MIVWKKDFTVCEVVTDLNLAEIGQSYNDLSQRRGGGRLNRAKGEQQLAEVCLPITCLSIEIELDRIWMLDFEFVHINNINRAKMRHWQNVKLKTNAL